MSVHANHVSDAALCTENGRCPFQQSSTMSRRGPELSPVLRARICELRSLGWSYDRIKKKHPEIPKSTIGDTCRNEARRINQASQPRSGAPRVIDDETRDHLVDIVDNINPDIKWRDLTRETSAHQRSVQRLFHDMGRRKWKKLSRPELLPEHAQRRLDWASTYQTFTEAD